MLNLDNLFARIKALGLNAKKVSENTGISTGNISDWKNGRSFPTAQKLMLLADYLDCSVDYLLGRTDIPEVNTLDNMVRIYTAARAKDGEHLDDNIQYVRETLIEKLRNAPASSDTL